jgi:hypothetical protein
VALLCIRKENGASSAPSLPRQGREAAGLELSAPAVVGLGGWGSTAGAPTSAEDGGADEGELKRA